jgi:hypothetical protein
MAARQTAIDAIMGEFSTYWTANATGTPPITWGGLPYDPPNDLSPWARCTVLHGDSDIVTLGGIGNRVWRSHGIVAVQVFTNLNLNRQVNDDLVETAIDAFRGKSVGTNPRVRFRQITAEEIGADSPWFQQNVTVKFEYDETV